MKPYFAQTTLVVHDYDEAIDFYVNKLGFKLVEDSMLEPASAERAAKRWVVVAPADSQCKLLLAQAATDAEQAVVGNQAGGRVFLFLYTDDFWRDYRNFKQNGVTFERGEPRVESYGTVAVFSDLYGNLWDLIEPAQIA